MTSLQKQLQALSSASAKLLVPDRKISSILFNSQEAAKYDLDTFHQLGLDGLEELIEINRDIFEKYVYSELFNENSKGVQRLLYNKEENQRLDEIIEEFLISLSPYLMFNASLKCLEWLIHRFNIDMLNVESILKCILPYYQTKQFTLIIQILKIEKDEWKWLIPFVKSAANISKSSLYSNVNFNFVNWLCKTLREFLNVHKEFPANLRVFFAFFTSTIIGVLNSVFSVKRQKRRNLDTGKVIMKGLWVKMMKMLKHIKEANANSTGGTGAGAGKQSAAAAASIDLHSMIYIILAMLGNISKENSQLENLFDEEMLLKIIKLIINNYIPQLKSQAFMLANFLISLVEQKSFLCTESPKAALKILLEFGDVSETVDLWDISSKIIYAHTAQKKNPMKPSQIWKIMDNLQFSIKQRSELLKVVFLLYKKNRKKWLKSFLSTFERKFPNEFDLVCKSGKFSKELADFQKSQNLFILSQHPEPAVRVQAMKKLILKFKLNLQELEGNADVKKVKVKVISTPKKKSKKVSESKILLDTSPTALALFKRFSDEDPQVLKVLLKLNPALLLKIFSLKTLIDGLIQVVDKNVNVNNLTVKLALKKLGALAAGISEEDKELKAKVFKAFLPFLFPRSEKQLENLKKILSKLENDSLFIFKRVLDKNDSITYEEFSKKSYDIITGEEFDFCVIEEPANEKELIFSLLTLNSEKSLDKLLDMANKFNYSTFNEELSYPVTNDSFSKCLKLSSKNGKISLEFLFTTLILQKNKFFKSFEVISKIFKFCWFLCKNKMYRDLCSDFFDDFIQSIFETKTEFFKFWAKFLIKIAKENNEAEAENEFLMINCIKQFKKCIENLNFKNEELSQQVSKASPSPVRKRVTRSMKPNSSPARPAPIKISSSSQEKSDEKESFNLNKLIEILLFLYLPNDSKSVRNQTIKCLEILHEEDEDLDLEEFISLIIQYKEEVLADKEQIPILMKDAFRKDKNLTNKIKIIIDKRSDNSLILSVLNLCKLSNSIIFPHLRSTCKELLSKYKENDAENEYLTTLLNCFDADADADLSPDSLDILKESLKHKDTCKVVLAKLTGKVFDSYELAAKRKLFALMITSAANCELPEIKVSISRCVRKWILDAQFISIELDNCINLHKIQTSFENTGKRSKRKSATGQNWTIRTESVLEFAQSKKRIVNKTKLIFPLFKLLKICLVLEEQTPVEYLKQLILTSLTICCQIEESHEKNNPEDWVYFNVETVIDCLRCSRNPQTHHHALILLNYASHRYPEQVLHGVMSLFTYMGNSILRQDDTYSTQLIQQTVTTIIPTLAKTAGKVPSFSMHLVSAGIYRVFSSSVKDIPVHRRLPIFKSLAESLNPGESLWQYCIIIIDSALKRDKKRSSLNEDLKLASDLVWSFDPKTVLSTIEKVYLYLSTLPVFEIMGHERFLEKGRTQNTNMKSIIDLSRKESHRDVQIVINFVLELVSNICFNFANLEEKNVDFDSFLEKCFTFSRLLAGIGEDKIFKLIAQKNFDIIEKINLALGPTELVRTIKNILSRDDIGVKRKMLDVLNQRLTHMADWFTNKEILLQLIPPLVNLSQSESYSENEEMLVFIQTCFLTLKLIAKHLAPITPDEFVRVFELSLDFALHKNKLLRASALLTLGELFVLKSLILPHLNVVTKAILRGFKSSLKLSSAAINSSVNQNENEGQGQDQTMDEENDNEDDEELEESSRIGNLLCLSSMTCLNRMIENLGLFVGAKFIEKALILMLNVEKMFENDKNGNSRKKIYEQRLKNLLKTIGKKIPLRSLLQPLRKAFGKLHKTSIKSSLNLIEILKDSLLGLEKAEFNSIMGQLSDAFLDDFLQYRENISEVVDLMDEPFKDEEIDQVEDSIFDCLVSGIIMKMSESNFRPFYHKIFTWAENNTCKQITFYRLSGFITEKLKSLFVSFAGHIIESAAGQLNVNAKLTGAILKYFYMIFSNDREGFITTDRFNTIMQPLVDLMESKFLVEDTIEVKLLGSTLIQLAMATNDLNLWQKLVEQIAYKSRNPSSKVKLFVVSIIESAAVELEKDFLPLLPPAIPFLADLLNDDDTEVENETQKMLLKLENILGEPLQPYFVNN